MSKYFTEFMGTFFLVLTIGLVIIAPSSGPLAPLAISGILMGVIFIGAHVSGAHYNPAVTLAVWLRGHFPSKDMPLYILMQVFGAVAAA